MTFPRDPRQERNAFPVRVDPGSPAGKSVESGHTTTHQLGQPSTLTDQENLALVLAVAHFRRRNQPGTVETQILQAGYWSGLTAFWVQVNDLIDDPRAIASSPVTCRVLREHRDRRNTERGH